MSLLGIVVIVWWLMIAVRGFRRGLVRTAITMVSFIVIMVMVSVISPVINRIIVEQTTLQEIVEEKCAKGLEAVLQENENPDRSEQISTIEKMQIPMLLKEELLENNNSVVYNLLSVDTFAGYLAAYLAAVIIQIVVYLISFILASIILKIILNILDLFSKLPILGGINRLGGFMLGTICGLLYLWIFFLVITIFSGTELGGYLLREVAGDKFLDYLYENNLLLQFLMSILI